MTRSWVWTARGHLATGFAYNPAGATLLLWVFVGGVIGGVRLATGQLRRFQLGFWAWFAWALVWCGPIWLGLWGLRVAVGLNPLP